MSNLLCDESRGEQGPLPCSTQQLRCVNRSALLLHALQLHCSHLLCQGC